MVEAVQCHHISLVLCCADVCVCVLFLLSVLDFQFQVLSDDSYFTLKTDVSFNRDFKGDMLSIIYFHVFDYILVSY